MGPLCWLVHRTARLCKPQIHQFCCRYAAGYRRYIHGRWQGLHLLVATHLRCSRPFVSAGTRGGSSFFDLPNGHHMRENRPRRLRDLLPTVSFREPLQYRGVQSLCSLLCAQLLPFARDQRKTARSKQSHGLAVVWLAMLHLNVS